MVFCIPILDRNVLALDIAGFLQAAVKRNGNVRVLINGRSGTEEAYYRPHRLLRQRHQRPQRRTAQSRDELPPSHFDPQADRRSLSRQWFQGNGSPPCFAAPHEAASGPRLHLPRCGNLSAIGAIAYTAARSPGGLKMRLSRPGRLPITGAALLPHRPHGCEPPRPGERPQFVNTVNIGSVEYFADPTDAFRRAVAGLFRFTPRCGRTAKIAFIAT